MLIEPMNIPLGVSPSKWNQGTTRGKEKSFDLGGNRTRPGLTPSGLFMGLISTKIYTSELILCFTIYFLLGSYEKQKYCSSDDLAWAEEEEHSRTIPVGRWNPLRWIHQLGSRGAEQRSWC